MGISITAMYRGFEGVEGDGGDCVRVTRELVQRRE